jgi:hypothetical protein
VSRERVALQHEQETHHACDVMGRIDYDFSRLDRRAATSR